MNTKLIKCIQLLIFLFIWTNLYSQENNITEEERRARIVETYNRRMSINENSVKGDDDPLPEAMAERFFTGAAAGDDFGFSVASAGDVNGDGYTDVIVGAYGNDAGGTGAGRAYIYFGGAIINNTADVILTGEALGDYFGTSVSSAGDVNGDGYSDVIVGAPYNSTGGTGAGRSYVYFGGASMDNTPDVTMTGEAANDRFGISVSTAGDANGDGYSDVIVGADFNDAGGISAGRTYIYFGGASMDNIEDVLMTGEAADNVFGISVSTSGDVNGDGYSDVIVGASNYNSGTGRAYIFFGGPAMNNVADVIMTGEAANDYFGTSVSIAGDVNGDGYSDVIVGAWGYSSITGRAYIYYGGTGMDNIADVILTGEAANNLFGYSVSTAGDVNGDGYTDVVVGAYGNDAGGSAAGRAYIYFGGISMDNIADVIMTGEAANDYFGYSVSTAGDVNGDGYSDVIVGADGYSSSTGRAYLYLNSLTGSDIPDEFFTGENADDQLGYSLSNAGDVNGDGFDDLIVGAPLYDDITGANNGRAYIYFGGNLLDNNADVELVGDVGPDLQFGYSVSSAGDINGDGFDDVIVGAPLSTYGGVDAGTVYIFFGGSSMTGNPDLFIDGSANENLGWSVSTAGDVNGDGFSDILVGVPSYNSNEGIAYIYYGDVAFDIISDVTLQGSIGSNFFGNSVSAAGDVNGDGYSDVIVGAYLYNSGTGRAFIYLGGPSMDSGIDVFLTGEATGNSFGYSVSTAGDVNADGYSDVIVGASNYASSAGRAYIYFGGPSMNNVADVIMTGEGIANYFGSSVSTAGDVNGDGYSDVIVGAWGYSSWTGLAYIYFGGSLMNNIADVVMTGEEQDNIFGGSVSTAGDINKDGYSDVIVGARYNSAGGVEAGRAYLYLSSSPLIKPRITSVKDVPFDQGGQVQLKWARSGYDVQGISTITDYLIQRSFPPDENGFSWENIATMPASNEPFYSYVAETPNDSMTNNSGTYYFRITARTANPNEYWRSNIMYGHSVDNLAPLAPAAFYANLNGSDVHLGWDANLESDFRDYYIYRSDTPVGDTFTLLGTTTDTTYVDTSPIAGNAYYYVQAYDIHDNGSALSGDSVMAFLSANIKVFLEGPYVGGQMSTFLNVSGHIPLTQPFNTAPWNYTGSETVTTVPANVTDWILVELRSTTTAVVDRRAAFIKNDGNLVDLDGVSNIKFPTATAGDYYVVIIHRNHLPVMTANKVAISFSPTLYDMRNNLSNIYGTNAVKDLGDGNYGMVSGDANGNGQIQNNDSETYWAVQNGQSGYREGDYNLNGQVQNNDRETYWVPNNGRGTQVP